MRQLYVDETLGYQVIEVLRPEWGATVQTEAFIRNRFTHRLDEIICCQAHHTAAIDVDDATPNQWDLDEAVAYMRRLQWSRPDLGPLPYPENPAISEDGETVWLFEGRGLTAVGAHTADHNRHGHALGFLANFDKTTSDRVLDIAASVTAWRCGDLRHQRGMIHLGDERSPRKWEVWGHRDSAAKSCPGNLLYPLLATVRFIEPQPPGDDDMNTPDFVKRLTVSDVDALVDANVINPGNPDKAAEKKFWRDKLTNPADLAWVGFHQEVEAQALVNAAVNRGGPHASLAVSLTGTAKPA